MKILCHYCGKLYEALSKCIKENIKRNGHYRCQSCASKAMHASKKESGHYEYYWKRRHDVKCAICGRLVNRKGSSILASVKRHNKFVCQKCIAQDPLWRSKVSKGVRQAWQAKPELREQLLTRLQIRGKISSIQKTLYSILDDLHIRYEPSFTLGYYEFDCLIPKQNNMKCDLLIECQGEYWHSIRDSVRRDDAKATYVKQYFPNYQLKYLWEHEFYTKDKIIDKIRYWVNTTQPEAVHFELESVIIKKTSRGDVKELLSKYHYLPNAGRGGIIYGAYVGGKLVACCVFATPGRVEMATKLKCRTDEMRELARFCIHPSYRVKNFGSWFLSRCLRALKADVAELKLVVSFCDTTYNHDGALYKACNFVHDGDTSPDYWYVDNDGYVMHKKTLYNRAVKMSMTEKQYANERGYRKVWGRKKLRFVYVL